MALKHETKLLADKGTDYRKKICLFISLSVLHTSSYEISKIMHQTHRQLASIMRSNPRLPKPFDWKNDYTEEELEKFYKKGDKTKYDNIIKGQYDISEEELELSETDRSINNAYHDNIVNKNIKQASEHQKENHEHDTETEQIFNNELFNSFLNNEIEKNDDKDKNN